MLAPTRILAVSKIVLELLEHAFDSTDRVLQIVWVVLNAMAKVTISLDMRELQTKSAVELNPGRAYRKVVLENEKETHPSRCVLQSPHARFGYRFLLCDPFCYALAQSVQPCCDGIKSLRE